MLCPRGPEPGSPLFAVSLSYQIIKMKIMVPLWFFSFPYSILTINLFVINYYGISSLGVSTDFNHFAVLLSYEIINMKIMVPLWFFKTFSSIQTLL